MVQKKAVQKVSMKRRIAKLKKKSGEKLRLCQQKTKEYLNINRYNRKLFMFETILFVGVVDEFFESLIMKLDYGIYLNILLLMLSISILFTVALSFIENQAKGTIIWLVRLNQNKILRFIVHISILFILFTLYADVYFDTKINLVFNVGLNAT